jgi:type IV pilus assembly protein PilA
VSSPSRSLRDERGFTLVEVLVVVLIIGILAAIAIPAFLNQRAKAQDAEAKTYVVTAVKAMEIWHMDHGTFKTATVPELVKTDRSLASARDLRLDSLEKNTYELSDASAAGSAGGGRFRVSRSDDGTLVRSCDGNGRAGCPDDGSW